MLKTESCIEIKGNERRVYGLYFRPDSPKGELLDVLGQMRLHVLDMIKIEEMQSQKPKQ
jgi:hypothetical protein